MKERVLLAAVSLQYNELAHGSVINHNKEVEQA